MANITQTIPSLTAGISQQPDEQKIPGQVKDLENALPDVTHGLLKRPAGKFVGTLASAENDGKWFHYYRDENEQYIGQVHRDGAVKMWACTQVKKSDGSVLHEAGAPVNVVDGIGNATYLTHTKDSDIQTLTLNDFTYIANRSINTAMDSTIVPVGQFEKEVYVELKAVAYAKQYGLNLFDGTTTATETINTATRIKVEKTDTNSESTLPHVDTQILSLTGGAIQSERLNVPDANTLTGYMGHHSQLGTNTGAAHWRYAYSGTNNNYVAGRDKAIYKAINTGWDGEYADNMGVIPPDAGSFGWEKTRDAFVSFNNDHAADGETTLTSLTSEEFWSVYEDTPRDQKEDYTTTGGVSGNYPNTAWSARHSVNPAVDTALAFTRYYKLKFTDADTGAETVLITGRVVTSDGSASDDADVFATDLFTAIGNATAHTIPAYTVNDSGKIDHGQSEAGYTTKTLAQLEAQFNFTLSSDSAGLIFTYSSGNTQRASGQWTLTRCNSPTGTGTGYISNSGIDTTGSGTASAWNEYGRDRPYQGFVDKGTGVTATEQPQSYQGIKSKTVEQLTDPTKKDLYVRVTTTGQAIPSSDGNTYSGRYTTTYDLLHGGQGWYQGDGVAFSMKDGSSYQLTVEKISTAKVKANLGLIRPTPTSFDTKTTVTADSILGDMRNAIIAETGFNATDVEQIGSGLYIKKDAKFSASTPVKELLNVVASQVNDIGDLPSQCKHGMVVEVVNSVADEDNHYVQFHGNGGLDGAGVWEECAKPGRKNRFDYAKMPITLIRTADGNFRLTKLDGSTYGFGTLGANFTSTTANNTVTVLRNNHGFETGDLVHIESDDLTDGQFIITKLNDNEFTYISASNEGNQTLTYCIIGKGYTAPLWEDAIVGDDVTNPEPSFIGKPINKMLFFRNRLALLSEENIILSRPGEFFNFFATSAIQFIASDPIDVSASSTYPATLYDGIQVNAGLILFTKNQQFMLTTDSDILSVQTVKINSIATYNFNSDTNPISLGTTIGFLDNANKHSRFFEMASALREGEPEVVEQSAVVSRLFDNDLKLISNSRENSVIFFSEADSSTLYGYKYFESINQRKLASWFKWTVEGTIKYHCMQDDNLFAVVKDAGDNNNPDYNLLKFSLKPEEDTTFTVDGLYDLHLDHMYKIPTGTLANYSTSNGTTAISLPATSGLVNHTALTSNTGTSKLFAYNPNSGSLVGTYKQVVNSGTLWLIVNGNWSQGSGGVSTVIPGIVVGFNYTMKVDIPTLYYQKQSGERWVSDTRADTILHRVKLGFGPVGTYETKLKCLGKTDYNQVFEVTPTSNPYASGITNDETLTTIPIYNRNINTSLTIESTHPTPMTLHHLTWEGTYTDKNYSRV